ncbi:hypothetical protein GH714_013629 [Hevea brasiliensis]|uniref:Retroviral polymerase SH3-like domain-containing protein n=1 Tax=Hevea brasiliensis TaxID=3981 RepID=A0A6A6LIZ1_HEVBR|nr:hypothetical protein GH714_013629 [Hevea brasiliensis]
MHITKDERSKLNAKIRQCIFIGYGQDKFGYRCYDPVEKKLVRNRDVTFIEDQTIEDIDKADRSKSETDGLIDLDPTPITDMPNVVESLLDNHAFELVKLPKDRKALKNRWVYRVKHEENSSSR